MQSPPNEPEGSPSPDPEEGAQDLPQHQDTFRRVYFGQIADPLIPPHPAPAETPEDELTRAALSDPDALKGETPDLGPTSWRWVFLLLLAVVALGIIFWKR